MKVGVVGLGYVGLSIAIVFAEQGNTVIGVEVDSEKVEKLRKGIPTMFEPGIKEHLERALPNLHVSSDYSTLSEAKFIYVAVPTPTVDNRIDLSYVEQAALSIKAACPNSVIVIKSTVVPGTARKISALTGMEVVSNPEFTREGHAIEDTLHPDRIVLGAVRQELMDELEVLFEFSGAQVIKTNNENAELIKYASNAYLATKISYANELAKLCERVGCDVDVVTRGMGLDKRIGPQFLKPGLGWGGSCFPKDTQALVAFAEDSLSRLTIVETAIEVNNKMVQHAINLIKEIAGGCLSGKRIGVLGVTFKEDTDDVRSSKSIELIERLSGEEHAQVNVYDPIARYSKNCIMYESLSECVANSDIIVVATEWDGFRSALRGVEKPVLDMRRILDLKEHPGIYAIGLGRRESGNGQMRSKATL
ncbi:MAG: UDP-glucose/GDP-mannose dehydrogenase family protein [Candidatus Micrarchaeales archaeon]|nr:UDP-glucose/GDP-mannose dehydrogenase family protein [Candidatus Micrarchaeales archaeon]